MCNTKRKRGRRRRTITAQPTHNHSCARPEDNKHEWKRFTGQTNPLSFTIEQQRNTTRVWENRHADNKLHSHRKPNTTRAYRQALTAHQVLISWQSVCSTAGKHSQTVHNSNLQHGRDTQEQNKNETREPRSGINYRTEAYCNTTHRDILVLQTLGSADASARQTQNRRHLTCNHQ